MYWPVVLELPDLGVAAGFSFHISLTVPVNVLACVSLGFSIVFLETVQCQLMNPRELRIGNYVMAGGVIMEVVAIDSKAENDIEIRSPRNNIIRVRLSDGKVTPLLIDRELLTSCCGFDDMGRLIIDIDVYLYFLQENDGYIILMSKGGAPIIHFWDVRAIHQLQNLYYSFKGRELPTYFHQHSGTRLT